MLAKSTLVFFVLAVGLSLSLNGNPSVASAVPTKLSHTGHIDADEYYKTVYEEYYKTYRAEPYQDQNQNTLQQAGSNVTNHFGSEVEQKGNIYEGTNGTVDESHGSKTFQTRNTYQQVDTTGTNYVGSRTFQEGNIYRA